MNAFKGRRAGRHGCLCIVAFAAVLTSSAVHAWEADVHYGLTKWLAMRAGIDEQTADKIALADWNLDLDPNRDAITVTIKEILFGDEGKVPTASAKIREDHFPAEGKPVGEAPSHRAVTRNNEYISDRVIDTIAGSAGPDKLGEALHAFQDSWSHQGLPSIAFDPFLEIRPTYAWGHPQLRGNWYSHAADHTFRRFRGDQEGADLVAVEMAEHTYEMFGKYCTQHVGKCKGAGVGWEKHVDAVRDFAARDTIAGKRQWFATHAKDLKYLPPHGRDFPADFLLDTSLPLETIPSNFVEKEGAFTRQVHFDPADFRKVALGTSSNPKIEYDNCSGQGKGQGKSQGFVTFAGDFVDKWMESRGRNEVLKGAISREHIGQQLRDWAVEPYEQLTAENWIKVYLRMWFAKDHGVVQYFGHGSPRARAGYQVLLRQLDDRATGDKVLESVARGTKPLEKSKSDSDSGSRFESESKHGFNIFTLRENRSLGLKAEGLCGLTFRFNSGIPRDSVVMFAGRISGSWQFVRLAWIAE